MCRRILSGVQRLVGVARDSCIKDDIPNLIGLYQKGKLKLDELVSNTYPLNDINSAIETAERGEALRNVIVFD